MGITDLFRSKHRHSDPDVRIAAVREMEPDPETFAAIAREDDDVGVRREAIDRIDVPDLIAELAGSESDMGLSRYAKSRAASLWASVAIAATDLIEGQKAVAGIGRVDGQLALVDVVCRAELHEVREEALERVRDARALRELARSEAPVDIRIVAVERITDLDVLRALAVDEDNKRVALAALDRIADRATLEIIASKAKNKVVRSRAGKFAAGMDPEQQVSDAEKRARAERIQLVRQAEAIAKRHEWVQAFVSLNAVEAAWRGLSDGLHDPELERRFHEACQTYRERREKYATAAERQESATPPPIPGAASAPAAPAPESAPESASECASESEAASESESEHGAEEEDAHPDTPDAAAKRTANLEALEKLVASLADIDQIKKLKTAEKKHKSVMAAFDALSPLPSGNKTDQLVKQFKERRRALFIKVQELRDADEWQRWANVPKREALIATAKELLAVDDDPHLAKKLKDLQTEWKGVGPVPQKKGQELWLEFKATCDAIYEKVKEYRGRMSHERSANLTRKRELVAQVEALKESSDWVETAEQIKRLQAEWKKIGPVPRKHADAIWKQFRGACDYFFERRKPHLEKDLAEHLGNLERKEALVARAVELSESTDWRETADELKRMQRQWRDIGHVPRKDLRRVNDAFRAACDKFFQRRESHFEDQRKAREQKAEELTVRVATLVQESTADGADAAEAAAKTITLRSEVLAFEDASRKTISQLRAALADACRAVVEAHPDQFGGTELDPEVNRKRKEKLCLKAEELVPEERKAPTTAEEMAAQLRAALADRALGGVLSKRGGGRPVADVVEELRESWLRLGPVPGPDGAALEERFKHACERSLAEE